MPKNYRLRHTVDAARPLLMWRSPLKAPSVGLPLLYQAIGMAVARPHWMLVIRSREVTEVLCDFVSDVALVCDSVRVLPAAPHREGITIDSRQSTQLINLTAAGHCTSLHGVKELHWRTHLTLAPLASETHQVPRPRLIRTVEGNLQDHPRVERFGCRFVDSGDVPIHLFSPP